jgi:hypothetical protein
MDAIETGYKEAVHRPSSTPNITNTIAAALDVLFRVGPIRGFAVVLMIGIITSVFTCGQFHPHAGGAVGAASRARARCIFRIRRCAYSNWSPTIPTSTSCAGAICADPVDPS